VSERAGATASIPMLDLKAHHAPLEPELRAAFERVLASGQFILGSEVESFERKCAERIGVPHAIGVSSGTDGLLLALMALGIGPGDEVITTPFSFFATAGSVARTGANPVFVDVDERTFDLDPARIEAAITERTKVIMPVHLFGRAADMDAIGAIARARGLAVIEDAAQALGAATARGKVGALGTAAVFSFFPSKNVGGFGDAGLVTTADDALADRMRLLRHHGMRPKYVHHVVGGNFRIDALQAALLSVKIEHESAWSAARRANAGRYDELFAEAKLPADRLRQPDLGDAGHVWNQYTIRSPRRDALRAHLAERGIASEVYYPLGLHLQPALAHLGYREGSMPITEQLSREVLSLPIYPELGEASLRRVADEVIAFAKR
jgi:dTDP-4-amino-4,6-dideoxygalactose transaminase